MAQSNLKAPEELRFEGNIAENYQRWIQRYELFEVATGLNEKPEKIQCATFLHVAGEEALRIFNTFEIPTADKDKIEKLKDQFQKYTEPKKNLTYIRHLFHTRNQRDGETMDSFITNQSRECDFKLLTDDIVKDRIICGIQEERLRMKLLSEADLKLARAVEICRLAEITSTQTIKREQIEESTVDRLYSRRKPEENKNGRNPRFPPIIDCTYCGTSHPRRKCPAYGKTCAKCGRKNHAEAVCYFRKTNYGAGDNSARVHAVGASEEDPELFIGTVYNRNCFALSSNVDRNTHWHTTMSIGVIRQRVKFKLDTGAEVNVLPIHIYNSTEKIKKLEKRAVRITGYGGNTIPVEGVARLRCQFGDVTKYETFVIASSCDVEPLLSLDTCLRFNLVQRINEVVVKPDTGVFLEYPDVFQGLGCIKDRKHTIVLQENATPVVHPPRKMPFALRERLKKELDWMEQLGVIQKVDYPTDWVNSIHVVEKPDKSLRVCLDPFQLNKSIKREYVYLPT